MPFKNLFKGNTVSNNQVKDNPVAPSAAPEIVAEQKPPAAQKPVAAPVAVNNPALSPFQTIAGLSAMGIGIGMGMGMGAMTNLEGLPSETAAEYNQALNDLNESRRKLQEQLDSMEDGELKQRFGALTSLVNTVTPNPSVASASPSGKQITCAYCGSERNASESKCLCCGSEEIE